MRTELYDSQNEKALDVGYDRDSDGQNFCEHTDHEYHNMVDPTETLWISRCCDLILCTKHAEVFENANTCCNCGAKFYGHGPDDFEEVPDAEDEDSEEDDSEEND